MFKWIASIRAGGMKKGGLYGALIGISIAFFLMLVVVLPVQSNLQRGSDQQYLQEWGRPTAAPIVERGSLVLIKNIIIPSYFVRDVGIRYNSSIHHLVMTEAETSGPTVNVWRSQSEGLWFGGNGSHPPIGSGDTIFGVFATILVMCLWLIILWNGYALEMRYNDIRDQELARQKEAQLRQLQADAHTQLQIDLEEHFRNNPPDPQELWARVHRLQSPN